jgi:ligand-binding sensor domain-containing protein/serine phosphatase RsbU (regulator of sigma subunit)
MKDILIFFNLLFILSGTSLAQTNEVIFSHYTVDDGISQSSVSCILQDSQGYIWFGTQDGLNRFNGYSFERYYHNPLDTTSISHGWVYAITEDADGNIWIGTRGGLNKFDKKTGVFEQITAKPGKKNSIFSNVIYGVTYYEGQLLINTPPVLNIMDLKTREVTQYKNTIDLEKKTSSLEKSFPVIIDKKKNVWVASAKGLSKFDLTQKNFRNYTNDPTDLSTIPDNYINTLYEDNQGDIWVGTINGFCRYDLSTDTFIRFENRFKNNSILSILQDDKGDFWFGTFGGGLNQVTFNPQKKQINDLNNFSNNINNGKTIISDVVSSLYEDRSHIIWIGSFLGLNKLDLKPKKFLLYKKTESEHSVNLLDNFIASEYLDKNDILWIGNWGKGLNLFNRKTGAVKHYAPTLEGKQKIVNGYVQAIFKDPENRMWIATRNGIQVLNTSDSSFVDLNTYLKIEGLPEFRNVRMRKIIADSKKNIWICCDNGLYKIDQGSRQVTTFLNHSNSKSISDNVVNDIVERKDGKFWVSTVNGLNLYDPATGSFDHYYNDPTDLNTISSNMSTCLLLDRDDDLWVGTNSGLNLLKKGSTKFIYYSKKEGLPNEYIYCLVEDASGKIWLSTNRGIAVLNKKNNTILSYNNEDGLQGLEFNGGASFKSPAGELFFGGVAGLNSFFPDAMPKNDFVPPIVITTFENSNEAGKKKRIVQNGDVIELSYSDYEIIIEFAALDYTNSKANQYAYKMEGLSNDWIDVNYRNFVTFSKLPPDKYVFSVLGSNNDKLWNTTGASITIIIHPPFWRTWWFYTVCGIIILSIVVFLIKLREKSLMKEKKVLEEKVQERTEKIVYQNEEIEKQKNELIKKNIKITDSIDYAKKIQDAFLPNPGLLNQVFPDSFVLFLPKDIVSGDFYWLHTKTGQIVFAVGDCTGHGVPGAFMSLISINLLNEIMEKKISMVPSEILESLRRRIIDTLTPGKEEEERRQNGLDLALCVYDPVKQVLSYSGAKNPLYLFRNNTFKEIKADRLTVGMFYNQEKIPFTNYSFPVEKGDVIYLFSDGFADQKGGTFNKKYYYQPFKELFLRIHGLSMAEQKKQLELEIKSWRGNNEQIDDILIMGIRF